VIRDYFRQQLDKHVRTNYTNCITHEFARERRITVEPTRAQRRNKLGLSQGDVGEALALPTSTVCAIENEEAHRLVDEYLTKEEDERFEEMRARRSRKRTRSPVGEEATDPRD